MDTATRSPVLVVGVRLGVEEKGVVTAVPGPFTATVTITVSGACWKVRSPAGATDGSPERTRRNGAHAHSIQTVPIGVPGAAALLRRLAGSAPSESPILLFRGSTAI